MRSEWWPGRAPVVVPERVAAGTTLLAMHAVAAARRDRQVLFDIDLEVRAGELVALVGPNGSGKSSLLATISGDLESTGTIEIADRPASGWKPVELALRRAVLPQHVAVAFPFLARDVVQMGRAPWRSLADEDDDRVVAEVLGDVDAIELAERRVTALSGGERARVALARVLAQRAQLLLLDEPTAALDLSHQEMVMRVLRTRAAAGDAVVVVLHDLSLAAAHAERMVVIDAGRIVADGPSEVVCEPDLLSRVYAAPVEVLPHPRTGAPMVLPVRPGQVSKVTAQPLPQIT